MASWMFLLPDYIGSDYVIAGLWLVLGGVCAIVGMTSVRPLHVSEWYVMYVIPGLIGLVVVPFPFKVGFVFVLIGVFFVVVKWWHPVGYGWGVVASGLLFSGGLLIAQAVLYPLYMIFVVHGHRVDSLSSVVAVMLNGVGVSAAVNQGLVFVQTASGTLPISTTWEKVGLLPWMFLLVGFVVVLLFIRRHLRWKLVIITVVVSCVVVLVRYVIMIVWFISTDDVSLFWNPWIVVAGFIPVCMVLSSIILYHRDEFSDNPLGSIRLKHHHVLGGFFVFLSFGLVISAISFEYGDIEKEGRVLIDEVHSDWEDSVRPLDTEWFGLLSTYNYYSWAEWMNASYQVRRNVDHVLSEALLSEVDVLILKCPTNSYSAEEIGAITRFVEGGGGLWMIGDHTDVFGMNTFLNQVAPVFGIRFRNDATYELGSGNLTVASRPGW
jgi:hypothetical protein